MSMNLKTREKSSKWAHVLRVPKTPFITWLLYAPTVTAETLVYQYQLNLSTILFSKYLAIRLSI